MKIEREYLTDTKGRAHVHKYLVTYKPNEKGTTFCTFERLCDALKEIERQKRRGRVVSDVIYL